MFSGHKDNPTEIQMNSIRNYISYHVISLLEKVRESGTKNKLKSVILGCTHYPFYVKDFQVEFDRAYNYSENGNYIYREIMDKNIVLVDPAINTAKELYIYLEESELFNNGDIKESEFYISTPNLLNKNIMVDDNYNFTYDYKYGRNAGEIQEYVKRIPFSRNSLSPDLINRLSVQIPFTFELIESFNINNVKTQYLQEDQKISL